MCLYILTTDVVKTWQEFEISCMTWDLKIVIGPFVLALPPILSPPTGVEGSIIGITDVNKNR